MADAGRSIVEAFHYIRDLYENASRLVRAADSLAGRAGYSVRHNWRSVPPTQGKISMVDEWLPAFVIRQWTKPAPADATELLTVGTVFWDPEDDTFSEPWVLASRMLVASTPDEVYWLGIAQVWEKAAPPDEQVRVLSGADYGDDGAFPSFVVGGRMLGAAVPLLSVTGSGALFPLVKAIIEAPAPW